MTLVDFIRESNMIEGIHRDPTPAEIEAHDKFLTLPMLTVEDLNEFQAVIAPGKPLRDKQGMDVRVGRHIPVRGGQVVYDSLLSLLRVSRDVPGAAWECHVRFEVLHPYMDGNGRTGRALWAWLMLRAGHNPLALGFLHRFYYQTLDRESVKY